MESLLDSTQVRKSKNFANGQVNEFLAHVEDLTKSLQNVETPEIARVRAKVKIALVAAKSAAADGAAQMRHHARRVGKSTDTYVRDNPWQVVGIAALLGIALGMIAARRGGRISD